MGRHAGRAAGRAVGQSALVALRRLLAVWRRGEGVPLPWSAGEIARRTRDGWVWGIDQTVEEGQAAGVPGRYEDGDDTFPTAAEAAAAAERRIAEIEAGEHRRLRWRTPSRPPPRRASDPRGSGP